MIFCVSPDPYHAVHGSSPGKVRQLFHELENMGIGGVNVSYKDPNEHPEWVDYKKKERRQNDAFWFMDVEKI